MASQEVTSALDQRLEDYETKPVPEGVSRNWLDQGLVWAGITFCLAAWFTGGALTAGLGFWDTLIVLTVGAAVLTVIGSLTGMIGATTHLSTAMSSRFAFGETGSKIIGAVLSISLWGWFAFQAGLFGLTFQIALKQSTGTEIPVWLPILIGGLAMMSTAILGYRGIAWLSMWAVPLMAILAAWALWGTFNVHPMAELVAKGPGAKAFPISVGIAAVVGTYAAGATIAPDIARYSKTKVDAFGGAVLGFFITYIPITWLGAAFAYAWGNPNIVEVMTISLNLGLFAYLILFLAQWTTNDNNLYSSALGLSNIIPAWPKWRLTLIVGVISTLIAMTQVYNYFLTWLILLSALIPPIAGVLIADFYLFNSRHYRWENIGKLKSFNWNAIIAWLFGSFVGIGMSPAPAGLNIIPGADIIPIPVADILAAVVLYSILAFAFRKQPTGYPSALQTG